MPTIESPQSRFVTEAAALLQSDSPSTSAYLLGVQTRMLHADFKSLNAHQHRHHCAACGRIRHTDTHRSSVTVRARKGAASQGSAGARVYKCGDCHHRTILPRKKKSVAKSLGRASAAPSTSTSVGASASASPLPISGLSQDPTPNQPKVTDNTSSKKRAKARKQGGLQALLASKQQKQPSLDLFDFLQ